MKTVILTSTGWTGEIEIKYNDASLMVSIDSSRANLTEYQQIWFLKNMPRELKELHDLLVKAPTVTMTELGGEITFEMFWNRYDEKMLSSKKKSYAIWNRLNKTNQEKAFNFIRKYEALIPPGVSKKYAETYLRSEIWNNDKSK